MLSLRYITFSKEEEAIRCIQSVHGYVLDGRPLRYFSFSDMYPFFSMCLLHKADQFDDFGCCISGHALEPLSTVMHGLEMRYEQKISYRWSVLFYAMG